MFAHEKTNEKIKKNQLRLCDNFKCNRIAQLYFNTSYNKKHYIFCSEKCLIAFQKQCDKIQTDNISTNNIK
jgi:YHS domain-containing protein